MNYNFNPATYMFHIDSEMDKFFFDKVVINWLASYRFTFSEDFPLEEVTNRLATHPIHRKWIAEYNRLMQSANPNAGRKNSRYRHPHEFLTEEDISVMLEMANESLPEVVRGYWLLDSNAVLLSKLLDLTTTEKMLINLAIMISKPINYEYEHVINKLGLSAEAGTTGTIRYLSRILHLDEADVEKAMNGFLMNSGMIINHNSWRLLKLADEIKHIFNQDGLTEKKIDEQLFPNVLNTELTYDSFPHLTKEIDRTERIINSALDGKLPGINQIFWGIPGVGKTELAITMAKKNGWNLKVIGDLGEFNQKEKSRAERLASLKLAMKLFKKSDKVVLLFDEIEDIFKVDNNATFSKAFINRIIETTPIPIIWTTNRLDVIGAPVLRRMVYNIELGVPPTSSRRNTWSFYNNKYRLGLDDELMDRLASNFRSVPSVISNACKLVSLAKIPKNEIEDILTSMDILINYGQKKKVEPVRANVDTYDLSCVNADTDITKLTEMLLTAEPDFSMCLFGPSGTGKSEYAKFLAGRMGKNYLIKTASSLISKWVGETEQNIAAAFKEAKDEEKFLIFDEGDTFLRSREEAKNSWEVSGVNEMLAQMESHTQPFVCTTNLFDMLDAASLRRFTFKHKFNYLEIEQAFRLFKGFFGVDAPDEMRKIDILTPGDFHSVRKKAKILHVTDVKELFAMLKKETENKPEAKKINIGF